MKNKALIARMYFEHLLMNLIFIAVILIFKTDAVPLLAGSSVVLAYRLYQNLDL